MTKSTESKKETLFSALIARRELISSLVGRNLKIRYKGSALGFLWSLLTPLSSILIYAVFAKLLKFGGDGYLPYLISGVIVWQFTISCVNDSLYAIAGNANLVKKVFFPRIILPLSVAFANAINYLFTILVLSAYLLLSGNGAFSAMYLALVAFVLQILLCVGLTSLFSTSNVFFRDKEHIASVITQAWFFLTPIMYPMQFQTDVLAKFSLPVWLAYLNPMTGILELYRKAFLLKPVINSINTDSCDFANISVSFVMICLILIAGIRTLKSGESRFGDVL